MSSTLNLVRYADNEIHRIVEDANAILRDSFRSKIFLRHEVSIYPPRSENEVTVNVFAYFHRKKIKVAEFCINFLLRWMANFPVYGGRSWLYFTEMGLSYPNRDFPPSATASHAYAVWNIFEPLRDFLYDPSQPPIHVSWGKDDDGNLVVSYEGTKDPFIFDLKLCYEERKVRLQLNYMTYQNNFILLEDSAPYGDEHLQEVATRLFNVARFDFI